MQIEIVNAAIGYDTSAVALNLDKSLSEARLKVLLWKKTATVPRSKREFPNLGYRIHYFLAEAHPKIVGPEQVDCCLTLHAQTCSPSPAGRRCAL
jgi:hypothetical protein